MKLKNEFHSLIKIFNANLYNLILSIILILIVPITLGPKEFGIWALYQLVVSYGGFLLFGLGDGINLKHSGEKLNNFNKHVISNFNIIILIYLIIMLSLSHLIIYQFGSLNVFISTFIIGLIVTSKLSYLNLVNQAFSNFNIYSISLLIEKTVVLLTVLIVINFFEASAIYLILGSISGRFLTIIYISIKLKLNSFEGSITKNIILVLKYAKIGLPLTMAVIYSSLVIGVSRIIIPFKLSLEDLGFYAFSISITGIFSQLTLSLSTVLFPLLRKSNNQEQGIIIKKFSRILYIITFIILLSYYPAQIILEKIFTDYHEGLNYLFYAFPIIIMQNRVHVLHNTLYKVYRLEKEMVKNVKIALLIGISIFIPVFYIHPNLEIVFFMSIAIYVIWHLLSVSMLNKIKNLNFKFIDLDIISISCFILINKFVQNQQFSLIAFIMYLSLIIITYNKLIFTYLNNTFSNRKL
ncbi:hypothetical protein LG275_12720 [Chryseomicrobium palamuruense]